MWLSMKNFDIIEFTKKPILEGGDNIQGELPKKGKFGQFAELVKKRRVVFLKGS